MDSKGLILDVCLILPLILLINSKKEGIPFFLLCNLYLRAFAPDICIIDPPATSR